MSANTSMKKKVAKAIQDETKLKPNGKIVYKDIGNNMLMIGYTKDNEPLIYYLKSGEDNIFNYYLLSDVDGERFVWDVRRHEPSHMFHHGENPLNIIKKILIDLYNYEIKPEIFYKKPSSLVLEQDELYGEVFKTTEKENEEILKEKEKIINNESTIAKKAIC